MKLLNRASRNILRARTFFLSRRYTRHGGIRTSVCARAGSSSKLKMDFREAGNIDPADFANLKTDCVLFYHPSCKALAKKVADSRPDIQLGEIDWGWQHGTQVAAASQLTAVALVYKGTLDSGAVPDGNGVCPTPGWRSTMNRAQRWSTGIRMHWGLDLTKKCFSDGFPNLFIRDALSIRNRNVAFLCSFHEPAKIFEQISVIYAIPRLFIGSFTLVLPFFPTGTLERRAERVQVEAEGEVATAFTLARMLSNIPLTRGGPASIVIFDIHALQERFYFGDAVLPLFESGIPLLLQRLKTLPEGDSVTVAYPDEGAWKRFHYQLQGFPEVICTKVRDGAKRIVRLKEGDPKSRHVVIVDDLVQSGGTLIECGKLLHSLGAAHVSAYVTHGVFPKASFERFEPETDGSEFGWKHVWITDSCPQTSAAVDGRAPFEIISLAQPIANALRV